MERGYVKLWRSIEENELLENDNTAFIVFTKLLTRVNRLNGTYTTGRNRLANVCNMNPNTLYSALKRLEASTIIQQRSNSSSTTITICNWWKYQQDVNNASTMRRAAVNTKQEREKEREYIKESNKEKSLTKQDDFNSAYKALADFWQSKTGRKLSDNKTSRSHLKKLLAEHTPEEIQRAINGAVYFQGKQYKPQVLSFGSMYEKWDSLQGHMQSEEGAKDESNRFE